MHLFTVTCANITISYILLKTIDSLGYIFFRDSIVLSLRTSTGYELPSRLNCSGWIRSEL